MDKRTYPKFRWLVMSLMTLVLFVNAGLIQIAPAPLVGEVADTTGWELGTVTAALIVSFTFFVAAGCVVSAFLLDRIGVGKTYVIACLIVAAGAFLMPAAASSLPGLVFLRLLEGLGAGFVMASPALIASQWFPPEEMGIVTGFQGGGIGLGITAGLIVSPLLFEATGSWVTTMTILGIAPAVCLLLSLILVFGPSAPAAAAAGPAESADSRVAGNGNFKKVLTHPLFYIALVANFAFCWVQAGYANLLPGYLAVDPPAGLGLGSLDAGNTSSLYTLFFTIGALSSGFIGRYVFRNRLKITMGMGFSLAMVFNVSVMFPAINENRVALVACLIMAGFFLAWCAPTLFAYLAQCYPTNVMGRVGGLIQGIATLGSPLGVAVGSYSLTMTGRYYIAIGAIGVMCLVGFVFSFFFHKPKVFAATAV